MSKRLIRTFYYQSKNVFVRSSASSTLEGAIEAAVMRLLRDPGVGYALIYDQRFGEVSNELTITIQRHRDSVDLKWVTPWLFPRSDPRKDAATFAFPRASAMTPGVQAS